MEADLVLVGSEQGGRIATLAVHEGDDVSPGDPIFTLEPLMLLPVLLYRQQATKATILLPIPLLLQADVLLLQLLFRLQLIQSVLVVPLLVAQLFAKEATTQC
jgi:multidrug efflux pump subunit AcrA (membrane-fusion protein)